jgi:CubicO group peptidase (beta-lactamase class C family)
MKRAFFVLCALAGVLAVENLDAQGRKTITECPADSIQAWLHRYQVPAAAVGIIENDQIKSIHCYGEIRPGVPAKEGTLWNVASLTKPVTAMTVISLVNKGQFTLDEPASDYYIDPDIKDDPFTGKLTAWIMLSHQTGFKNWPYMEPDKKLHFHFEPGTGLGYSGAGYEYLRKTVERKLGQPLNDIAKKALFIPAGMKQTQFGWSDGLDSARFAGAFDAKGRAYPEKYREANAADWLVTTMGDYCRFGLYVINGAGVSKKLFDEFSGIQVHFEGQPDAGMGLGWEVIRGLPNGEFALTHNGSDNGVATLVLLFPHSKRGIVIFTNGDDGYTVITKILKGSKIDIQSELAKSMGEFR